MADPQAWQETFKKIEQVTKRIRSWPPEQQSAEALIEIACQLIELNQGITDLTVAVQAVADAP
jgi:hypothetical protein